MNLFESLGLDEELLQAIKRLGYTKPTQIQEKTIPLIVKGEDVMGESATGSGKTLAFGCGVLKKVIPKSGLQALILTPTRELAEQVKESLRSFSHYRPMNIISVYGGVSINMQIENIPRADVVVATPGRILDHLQRGTINLNKIKLLVLDEADRMFDMGFIDAVVSIIRTCPNERQTLMFSATISSNVNDIAKKYMIEPKWIMAEKMVDPTKLKQVYYNVERNMKLSLLIHLLQNEKAGLVMVFCNSRRTTDFVVKNLKINKVSAIEIHGGLSQNKRTKTMNLFNGARVSVLVCTDVAARGLHIDNVSHVYNYEIPNDAKDYVHRIGRTARAGEEGKVINLLCDIDYDNFSRVLSEYRDYVVEKIERPYLNRVIALRTQESRDPRRFQERGNNRRFNRHRR